LEKSNEISISLNKYISSTGICSRREADAMIASGKVTINGQPTKPGNRVFEGDEVYIDGQPIKSKPRALYIALNKPVGIVCTTDQAEPLNIISFINHHERLFPIGRLDKPSEGLIFLTNDGDIVNKILRAGNLHEKEYIVTVRQVITNRFLHKMRSGIPILDTVTKPCPVEKINDHTFKIILVQGMNRQIRRMCNHLGYQVTKLKRVRIMHVKLGKLPVGQWRKLTKNEMEVLNTTVANSMKTEEASRGKKQRNKKKFPRTTTKRKRF
jgi:23S rRNA pseudouridine2604 synthase